MATREEWLEAAVRTLLDDVFNGAISESLIEVKCGWPRGKPSQVASRFGQCLPRNESPEGKNRIIINPILSDGETVLSVLTHELCHAIDDCQHGHGEQFAAIAEAAGLRGLWASTFPGPELKEKLKKLLDRLGPYPSAESKVKLPKVQKTFLRKAECPDCKTIIRITQKWIDAASARGGLRCPVCGTDKPMVVEEKP
jgi:hypothetical protein